MTGFYITIKNGLLEDGHRKRMGLAIWEFMWLIDHVTSIDENGVGTVLGGKPIRLSDIAKGLETDISMTSRNLKKLEEEKYIKTKNTGQGLIIHINKAKKIFNKKGSSPELSNQQTGIVKKTNQNWGIDNSLLYDNTVDILDKSNIKNSDKKGLTKKTYGDPVLNEGMSLLKELYPNATRVQLNRFALKRLVSKKNAARVFKAIRYAKTILEEKYAPQIYNYIDLEQKWDKLEVYARKQNDKKKPSFELSEGYIERN